MTGLALPSWGVMQPGPIPENETLLILWTSDDRDTALNMTLSYGLDAMVQGWWAGVPCSYKEHLSRFWPTTPRYGAGWRR